MSTSFFIPWLTVLLCIPLIGSVVIWLLDIKRARGVALLTSLVALAVSVWLVSQFDSANSQFQMVVTSPWIS
ncbi:MAG TPA: NADH-quinone oxidoreductase subunit M, partial [Gammaproteobacteria bacterium]|nr:NADH-quinone oxidoreductase subunit M [Gammaproteobacteria bacterium]